jgi:hypothetical protein
VISGCYGEALLVAVGPWLPGLDTVRFEVEDFACGPRLSGRVLRRRWIPVARFRPNGEQVHGIHALLAIPALVPLPGLDESTLFQLWWLVGLGGFPGPGWVARPWSGFSWSFFLTWNSFSAESC